MTLAPGIHQLSATEYHSDPVTDASLSAHIAHVLLTRSPKHAWVAHPRLNPDLERTSDDKFDLGTAAHALVLQGEQITEREETIQLEDAVALATVVDVDGKSFALVIDALDWRKNFARGLRDEARGRGLVALLAGDWARVKEMVDAIREQLPLLEVDPPMFVNGRPEQTLIWEEQGITCRALVDWLHDDFRAIDDLKTIPTKGGSANPHDWSRRTFWGIGADIEARFHSRGVKALTGVEPHFRFLVVEAWPPYAMTPVDLAPSTIALADRKIDTAIAGWRECLRSGVWPAYTTRLASVEVEPWSEADFLARHWQPEEASAA